MTIRKTVTHNKQIEIRFPKENEHLFHFMKRFERTALHKGWTEEEVNAVFDRVFWYSYHYTLDTVLNHCLFSQSEVEKL
ncbi:hypothetical protein [Dokdonia sp.]|uniref:hypothetical protein n=1 Tax=Dokdonia sp. TaxID=2024995 RepID=UPI0032642C8F